MTTLRSLIKVGDVLYGYCNGYFGRYYGLKTVEAVGKYWIVVREEDDGIPLLCHFDYIEYDAEYIISIDGLLTDWKNAKTCEY